MKKLYYLGFILLWISSVTIAYYFRTPLFASIRYVDALLVGLLFTGMIVLAKRHRHAQKLLLLLAVSLVPVILLVVKESVFQYKKFVVLHTNAATLDYFGEHFIVGFRSPAQAQTFVQGVRVGGLYVTARNIKGMDQASVTDHIQEWQNLSTDPTETLIIAADQEGGVVSHLSPPLDPYQTLGQVIASETTVPARDEAVHQYADKLGKDLAALGITLNLAPVVDVTHSGLNYKTDFTQIQNRSMSSNPHIVTEVAKLYTTTLNTHSVQTVYKHFPGLGGITADTHLAIPHLTTSRTELEHTDLLPFLDAMSRSDSAIMLSHVIWDDVDTKNPVSFSSVVITDYIRTQHQYEGVLLTDDFSMDPVFDSPQGISGAAVETLNAGTDLILITYDPDLMYEAMYGLIQAERRGKMNHAVIDRSKQRLKKLY